MPATHHQNTGSASSGQPKAPSAAPSWPEASVTWRTSRSTPKKPVTAGTTPSISPSDTLAATPDTLARHQAAQRLARTSPSVATMRGFQAMALCSRCSTNQFSAQPATSELANSSTPVKAANSSVGPSSVMLCSTYWPLSALTKGWPVTAVAKHCTATTMGAHKARLPAMPAICERINCATRSTKPSISSSLLARPVGSVAASAGAVIAGCLVATVQCSSMMSRKLAA